jgi:cell division protein FtsA
MRERARRSNHPKHVAGVLDIGTSKIACLIASLDPEGAEPPRILGFGLQRAQGVKGGVIIDLDRAEQSARAALAQAERMADIVLEEVRVSVSCGRLASHNFSAKAVIETGLVGDEDIARLLDAGQAYVERNQRTLVHMNEVALHIDGAPGSRDPRGMAAREIALDIHAVSADEAPLRNLLMVVGRCYLKASGLSPAPFASALAVTTADERRLGVTAVDIGAGTTTMAMFAEDRFIHADAAPIGGAQITFDVARALHTPLAEAERIKALYGTVVTAPSDEHDVISYPAAGDEEGTVYQMTRAGLAGVLRPRVKAIADHVRQRLESSELGAYAGRCLVLTGGTSQLTGLAEFMAGELGRPVRVAPPQALPGLAPALSSSAFSTVVGLLLAEQPEHAGRSTYRDRDPSPGSYLKRVGSWLREGF